MTTSSTKKTLTATTSPLNQKDVNAIETAFSQYVKLINQNDGELTLPAMFTHEDIGDLAQSDWPAFQYVVGKHGYVATKTSDGFRITQGSSPDPVWAEAMPN